MVCLKLSILSDTYSCLTEKDLDKCKFTAQLNISTILVLYTVFTMKMLDFTWITFSGFQNTLLQSLLFLPRLPILIYPSFMFSFFTISNPINICAAKISHKPKLYYLYKPSILIQRYCSLYILYFIALNS